MSKRKPPVRKITEAFGPRPRNAGFRCMDCGSEEYPIFGVAVAVPLREVGEYRTTYAKRIADWEPEASWHNLCKSCLTLPENRPPDTKITEDARLALDDDFRSNSVPRKSVEVNMGVARRRGSITLGGGQ